MEIKGSHKFAASPDAVWKAIRNPATLQASIPGAEEVSWQDANTLFARVKLGIGPISGTYAGTVQVAEATEPSHIKLVYSRNGTRASVDGSATIDLAPDGAGTVVNYVATATLGGALAALDNPLTRPLVDQGLNQFFGKLESQI